VTVWGYFRIFPRGEKFWRTVFDKTEPETSLNNVYEIFSCIIVYDHGIMLIMVGYCKRLQNLATFCRILSTTAKVSEYLHSIFVVGGIKTENRAFLSEQ
jgi:hypothetical protein